MKLLFDENLSPSLIDKIKDPFPGCVHVHSVGLGSASDTMIWEYARKHNFTILTKDSDFHDLCILKGSPPKVI